MALRVLTGALKGLAVGGAVGALCVYGLGALTLGLWTYLAAVLVAAMTAVVAGRPIWARDAKLESGLKAIVGGVVALVALFAVRKWIAVDVDLTALGGGVAALGSQPLAVLPALGAGLGTLFEVDNADRMTKDAQRVATARTRVEDVAVASTDSAREAQLTRKP
jgi:hypothetical protein